MIFKKVFKLFLYVIPFSYSLLLCVPKDVCVKKSVAPARLVDTHICSHELGFKTNKTELDNAPATIQGIIPSWIKGSFITIGPAVFEINNSKAEHWLDGLAMIHQFSIAQQKAQYSNKLIDSTYCKDCYKKGQLRGSTPEQKKSTWSKLTSALSTASNRPIYDNTNVNIACFNDQLVALTETPHYISVDKKNLKSKGGFKFDDKLEHHYTCPHPIFDASAQEWVGVAIQYAHNSDYVIYSMKANSTKRVPLATLSTGYPSYMHSFGLTKNYIILTETPFNVSPYDLLLTDNAYIETFNWKPKNGTNFIVIDRKTGKKVGTYKTDAFFTLHHVNAFEKDESIALDLIAYKDAQIIKSFYYTQLSKPTVQIPQGHLKRFTINLKTSHVHTLQLIPQSIEMPQYNPAYLSKNYRFLYATANTDKGFSQELIKLDLEMKNHISWHCNCCYPSEPIFVAKPDSKQEDEGIVLSVVLDAHAKKSFLLILDAKTFKEIGRAYAPHHIPFTIHSKFFAS